MIRLFHVSDVHFGREDKAAVAWFDALVRAEKPDGTAKEFPCLCTRCFEAERATSKVIIMKMGATV